MTTRFTKKIRTTLIAAAVTVTPFALAQMDNPDATLLEGLQSSDDYTVLLELLDATGLTDTFDGGDEYTLFAPDNEAFEDLDAELLESLAANPDTLTTILQAHVLEGRYGVNDLQDLDDEGLMSLQGEALNFNTTLGGLTVNGAGFDSDDVGITYANGVLHEIEDIILPRSLQATGALEAVLVVPVATDVETDTDVEDEDVAETAAAEDVDAEDTEDMDAEDMDTDDMDTEDMDTEDETDTEEADTDEAGFDSTLVTVLTGENLSTLSTALGEAGLLETLDSGAYTLFAPTDEAFDALPEGVLDALLADQELLTQVLQYHVVEGAVTSADLSEGEVETLAGDSVEVTLGDDVSINNAVVTTADIDAGSGVIHIIDSVLVPEDVDIDALIADADMDADAEDEAEDMSPAESLVAFLEEDGRFSDLIAALGDANVDLTGVDEFTLFAPTDDAFAAIDADALEDVDMEALLLYHVLPNRVMQENLVGSEEDNTTPEPGERLDGLATTAEGRDLLLTLNEDGSYTLNDEAATVVEANLMPSEDAPFVVHAIDAVLIPQDAEE